MNNFLSRRALLKGSLAAAAAAGIAPALLTATDARAAEAAVQKTPVIGPAVSQVPQREPTPPSTSRSTLTLNISSGSMGKSAIPFSAKSA